jgi:hypothetical protein
MTVLMPTLTTLMQIYDLFYVSLDLFDANYFTRIMTA